MRVIHKPSRKQVKKIDPPSWWRTFFKPTGTIVEHNGHYWMIQKDYSWGDYEGRSWHWISKEDAERLVFESRLTNTVK